MITNRNLRCLKIKATTRKPCKEAVRRTVQVGQMAWSGIEHNAADLAAQSARTDLKIAEFSRSYFWLTTGSHFICQLTVITFWLFKSFRAASGSPVVHELFAACNTFKNSKLKLDTCFSISTDSVGSPFQSDDALQRIHTSFSIKKLRWIAQTNY